MQRPQALNLPARFPRATSSLHSVAGACDHRFEGPMSKRLFSCDAIVAAFWPLSFGSVGTMGLLRRFAVTVG
jgi:hypothetical protein